MSDNVTPFVPYVGHDEELAQFCHYVTPLISGCSGFIRTEGYVTFIPGYILMMSWDETFYVEIPIEDPRYSKFVFGIPATDINSWICINNRLKKENLPFDYLDICRSIYFLGSNIKRDHLVYYHNLYSTINTKKLLYSEDDCNNIPNFEMYSNNIEISNINIIDYNGTKCRIPCSKVITPGVKGDHVSLNIYDYIYNDNPDMISNLARTFQYICYRKKLKTIAYVYGNILILN